MGKTKTAIIDDSLPQIEAVKPRKKMNPNPELQESSRQSQESRKKMNPNPEVEKQDAGSKKQEEVKEEKKVVNKKQAQGEVKKSSKFRSKKYQEAAEKVEKNKLYPLAEAVELAKQSSYSKFEGSLELHINTNLKNIRGLVNLPYASGKSLKVIAFGKGAEDSGADLVGDEEALKEIEKGKFNFDVMVTTPEWMPRLARAAKVLGPRGMMPNPKSGTISTDLKKAVSEIQSGKIEYKTQKDSQVIHLMIGKVNQPSEEIVQNTKILINAIGKTKAKKVVLSPSMGMGVKVNLSSL